MSLNTKDSRAARYLGAQLDALAMEVFTSKVTTPITKEQLAELFKAVYRQHLEKLDRLAQFERRKPTADPSILLTEELVVGEAYGLLADRGSAVNIDVATEQSLKSKGYDKSEIIRVIKTLEDLRNFHGARLSIVKLKDQIEKVGAEASATNIDLSSSIYLKAISEALLRAHDRYGPEPKSALDFVELLKEMNDRRPSSAPGVLTDEPALSAPLSQSPQVRVSVEPVIKDPDAPDGRVRTIAAKLIEKKTAAKTNAARKAKPGKQNEERAKAKGWDDKAVRQAEGIFALFERFLQEEYGFCQLPLLRQHHLSDFEEFLRRLNSNFGKSPKDKHRTVAELRAIAAEKGPEVGTLAAGTLNRHLTYLGQLIHHAKSTGLVMHPGLSTGDLRSGPPDRGRNQRPVPGQQQVEKLLQEPLFVGCAAWDEPTEPGQDIWHGALYYGTLLGLYQGLRREEFCGFQVDDVVTNGPIPYLLVRFTETRRVKNEASVRALAIHPELVRLGFLDYTRAMLELGYRRLFEDLYSPTTKSPLGDRYYDKLQPFLRRAGITPHQLRHFFNNCLKQRKVSKEFRADLLGHIGESETDERYVDPVELRLQLDILAHLPILSAHLECKPVRLLPWITEHRVAPFSRPSREKSKG